MSKKPVRMGKKEGYMKNTYIVDCPVCLSKAEATGNPKKEEVTIICTVCEAAWSMTPEEYDG